MRKGIISIIVATTVIGGAGTYGYAEMNAQHQAETQKSQASSHAASVKAASKSSSQKLADKTSTTTSSASSTEVSSNQTSQADSKSSNLTPSGNTSSSSTDSTTSQTSTAQSQDASAAHSSAQTTIDPNDPNLTPHQIAQLSPTDQAANLRVAAAQDPTRFKMDSAIVKGYSNAAIQSVPAWSHYSDSEINHFRSQD
ncbi:hypothetical protein IE337_04650 [Weissella viridescens]|uniref:hypothetical protein n=1 Tax=Weissella viridescens TaxID=1629 RepID=UPI001747B2E1|nr:hypothetical protein [Weissella viridescens]QOD85497.1 hypothetical protein IE337_04650 [Weissella viridescens]